MSKTTQKKLRRSATLTALINGAANLGYAFSGGFEAACAAASKLVPSDYLRRNDEQRKAFLPLIQDFGEQFKAGHLLRYLETRGYAKRFGNYDHAAKITACVEIMGKPEPTSDKANRRTEVEHKGVKAAQNAWTRVRDASGLKKPVVASASKKAGASKRRAAGDEKPVPTSRITVPAMHAPVEAMEFFQRIANDLGKATNANAKVIPIGLKSAVEDFRKAVRVTLAAIKAGQSVSARKPRQPKAPVAAVVAGNGAAKPNGASVQ